MKKEEIKEVISILDDGYYEMYYTGTLNELKVTSYTPIKGGKDYWLHTDIGELKLSTIVSKDLVFKHTEVLNLKELLNKKK